MAQRKRSAHDRDDQSEDQSEGEGQKKRRKFFECEKCEYTTHISSDFEYHMQQHKKPHQCPLCDYVAKRHYHITLHMRTHTKVRPYKCTYPDCKYAARQKQHLRRHIQTRHMKLKPYACIYCSYKSAHKTCLTAHIDASHPTSALSILSSNNYSPSSSSIGPIYEPPDMARSKAKHLQGAAEPFTLFQIHEFSSQADSDSFALKSKPK